MLSTTAAACLFVQHGAWRKWIMEQLGARAAHDEALQSIEQLRGDFASYRICGVVSPRSLWPRPVLVRSPCVTTQGKAPQATDA
jgi:hypothetical protein